MCRHCLTCIAGGHSLFFFLYQELFCDFNLSRVRKGRMRSGACLRLEFCLTGLPVLRGASCLSPPTHTPSVFYSHCFVLCVFICQTGRKNPSSFLPPFAGVSAALPPAISAFISLRVFLFFSFFFSRLRFWIVSITYSIGFLLVDLFPRHFSRIKIISVFNLFIFMISAKSYSNSKNHVLCWIAISWHLAKKL